MKINDLSGDYGFKDTQARRNTGELDKDDFLKLFIAQLQAQDPLSPMDNNEFVAQSATFTQLEQMTNLNTNITEFLEKQSAVLDSFMHSQTSGQALNLVDKYVTAYVPQEDGSHAMITGNVDKITFNNSVPVIHVNGFQVFLEEIAEVSQYRPSENE